jgi:hypothetical protein
MSFSFLAPLDYEYRTYERNDSLLFCVQALSSSIDDGRV